MKLHSVLVTGANRGIGLEFVKQLVTSQDAPEYVFATYRNAMACKNLEAVRQDPGTKSTLYLIKLDVTKKSDIDEAKKTIEDVVGDKGLTLLINNAGYLEIQSFPDLTEDNLNTHFSINTVGPIMVFQTMWPLLQKAAALYSEQRMSFSRSGVLNVTSGVGSIAMTGKAAEFDHLLPGYKISKAALNMAMRIAAEEVRERRVLVVNMSPGPVKTDMVLRSGEGRTIQDVMESKGMEVLSTEDSVSSMLESMASMSEANHASFVDRFGNTHPF